MTDLFWRIWGWFLHTPPEQLKCDHPAYARDGRLTLFPEQDAWEAYEVCLNCGREYHEKPSRRKSR